MKRMKSLKFTLTIKKKKRIFRSMRDLLSCRKRLKQGLKVLKIARRIKAKDKLFTDWHTAYLMNRNSRLHLKKKLHKLKRKLFYHFSNYIEKIKQARLHVKKESSKRIESKFMRAWVMHMIKHRKVKSTEEIYLTRQADKLKKKYFGEWIKLQLEIQAMRCWQQQQLMKLAYKGLLKNKEYYQIKKQLYYIAQNKRALFNIKSRFIRWKKNVAHAKLERRVMGTYVVKKKESLVKKSFYGWRIWLQEQYKLFEQKKISDEIYEFTLERKTWNGWELRVLRKKRERQLLETQSEKRRTNIIDYYFSQWIHKFNRQK